MSSEKEMRLIVLRGGSWNERCAQSNQDFVYVMNKGLGPTPETVKSLFTEDGQWNPKAFSTLVKAERYNATGKFQNHSGTQFEVFEYVGNDFQNIIWPDDAE